MFLDMDCSGLATLQGSAPATQGCLTQELEGKEEEEVVVGAAGNMEQASVSNVTGEKLTTMEHVWCRYGTRKCKWERYKNMVQVS